MINYNYKIYIIKGGEKSGSKLKKGMIQGKKMHYQFYRAYKLLENYY